MSELDVINRTKNGPITQAAIQDDLARLGVKPGMVLLVHSSLSAVGWVCGGPVAVILALQKTLEPNGTLVMPTHSTGLTDPKDWENPPVPEEWKDTIRQTMPAYDRDLTPCRMMGIIPETFRKGPGVLRSDHPHSSFSAWGKGAELITGDHKIDFGLGEESPLARIYDLGGWILLIGVGHENNTSLHLAECRAQFPSKKEIQQGAPIFQNGKRTWLKIKELQESTVDFEKIGEAYQDSGGVMMAGKIGHAHSLLIPQRDLIDFAADWMTKNRT